MIIELINVKTGLIESFSSDDEGVITLPAGLYELKEVLTLSEGIRIVGVSPCR